jgi:hypothetical protein
MRDNLKYEATDQLVVRALISENPWSTIVSHTTDGLVASHYPVLLDEHSDDLAVVIHGRSWRHFAAPADTATLGSLTRCSARWTGSPTSSATARPVGAERQLGSYPQRRCAGHHDGLRRRWA